MGILSRVSWEICFLERSTVFACPWFRDTEVLCVLCEQEPQHYVGRVCDNSGKRLEIAFRCMIVFPMASQRGRYEVSSIFFF